MSVTCGFYNSVNHDRRYNAKQMSSIFDGIINDGVFMNIGDALATTANSGMVVNVGTGRAWFNHSWTYNDSVLPLTVPTSHSVLDRIDAVVLEVNESDEVRDNTIKIVTGTASSTPAKPALTNTKFVHQYALAYITVKGGATAITQANITINVGMSDCPYITGILKTISADVLFKQWSGEFGEWFENIKTQLSGDVAGNLQNQIGTLSELKTTIKTNLVAAMNSIVDKLGSKDISKIGDGTVTGAILAQNQSLTTENGTKFRFGQTSDGEYGYILNKDGADTVIPFKKETTLELINEGNGSFRTLPDQYIIKNKNIEPGEYYVIISIANNYQLKSVSINCTNGEGQEVLLKNTPINNAALISNFYVARLSINETSTFSIIENTMSYYSDSRGAFFIYMIYKIN